MKTPYLFDEFFASEHEESISPFLTPTSRKWSRNLTLKSAASAAFLLALSFSLSFTHPSLSYLFLSFVYFLSGVPALIASLHDLQKLQLNIDVLMTLAAFIAVAIGSGLEGALLLVLFELSHSLEDTVSRKAHSALHNLNHIAPKFAHIQDGDLTYEKALRDITIGETILVKQGEIAPLDGQVLSGTSSVNLVHLTGETLPDLMEPGDTIPAGARNLDSALLIRVLRTSSDSTLSRIVQLITAAQEAKPRLQRWLDRFGKTYAATIIILTLLFALTLPLLLSIPYDGFEGSIYRALAFLIAASPCALIIATPTAYLSAISACARKGILLKGGITLDALASCRAIAFDKTGTLTTGDLLCQSIEPIGPSTLTTDQALSLAAALERHVVHPIASAITKLAASKNLPLPPIQQFHSTPGHGLTALYNNIPISLGRPEFITSPLLTSWLQHQPHNQLLAILSYNNQLFAFRFTDQLRAQTPALIHTLQTKNKLHTIMLTGDRAANAHHIASLLNIQTIYSDLRPEDKLNKVAALSTQTHLAMVGDGINDAPALARATVGISMGRIGSATAVDASDVVLLNDELHHLSWLFTKATHTQTIVKQNLALALTVICLATTPALLGLIPLWIAVLLHEGGTVLVGLNSLRLLRN
jgi:heavy metal translocating P-type ATPase